MHVFLFRHYLKTAMCHFQGTVNDSCWLHPASKKVLNSQFATLRMLTTVCSSYLIGTYISLCFLNFQNIELFIITVRKQMCFGHLASIVFWLARFSLAFGHSQTACKH